MPSSPRIFLAVPSYDGKLTSRAAQTIYTASTVNMKMEAVGSSSLLCYGFNSAWCMALNHRKDGITHFAMLHNDIQPEDGWIDTLIAEADKHEADIVSCVVPLKNNSGITSTAIDTDYFHPRRLTIRETASLPETFSAEDVPWSGVNMLLVNSGCWICRFTAPWVDRVCFSIEDRIERMPDGTFEPRVVSEDWNFSRFAHREDLKVMATTKVKLTHVGVAPFPNYGEWGQAADEVNMAIGENVV